MYDLLDGIRVLEVALLSPDSLGMHLADLGAEVIKIEQPPGGDYVRSVGGTHLGGRSLLHLRWNRGKKSVLLDLHRDDGRALFLELAARCQVVIDGLRAGALERYGVEPIQVPDFIALRGDPSDKIPGARGVGPERAATLLRRYATLEAAIAEGLFVNQAEALRLYRRMATMDATAPLPPVADQRPDWASGAALARQWELKALANRLEALAGQAAAP